ncbi:MAG: hypothetical protein H6620_05360 [Halobacteriovoraceae bacterium]|nr:hypothetical protein [Halobacteriovoraceae bacterium]
MIKKYLTLIFILSLGVSCVNDKTTKSFKNSSTHQQEDTQSNTTSLTPEDSTPKIQYDALSSISQQVSSISDMKSNDNAGFSVLLKEESFQGTLARLFDDAGLRKSHVEVAEDVLAFLQKDFNEKRLADKDEDNISNLIEKLELALNNVVADKCGGPKATPMPNPNE